MNNELTDNKLSLKDFSNKLKLKYTFGINTTDGASRRYHDADMGIGCEIHTPKNKHGEWGEGEKIFYIESEKENYSTIEELYSAYIKKVNNAKL